MSDDNDAAGDSNGDEDIDLALLSDEDLTAQMHEDLYDGLADEIAKASTSCWSAGGSLTAF